MATAKDEQARAARTYNSASDSYDDPANSFWERFGRETVNRVALQKGMRVLDVCCGSGASALAAAAVVGSSGYVLGLDLAEDLLRLARNKATSRGLTNVEFRVGDMLNPGIEDDFDAVICVFGIFFVSDMEAAIRQLWQRVGSGGQLAITTWGPRFFEPLNTVFWNSVRDVRPDLYKGFQPWDRVAEPLALETLLSAAGVIIPKPSLNLEHTSCEPRMTGGRWCWGRDIARRLTNSTRMVKRGFEIIVSTSFAPQIHIRSKQT